MTQSEHIAKRDRHRLGRRIIEFVEVEGIEAAYQRAREINDLPEVVWKGRHLKSLTCSACEQIRNVPECVCWTLIDFRMFRCASCVARG